jgi:hypothetical protein
LSGSGFGGFGFSVSVPESSVVWESIEDVGIAVAKLQPSERASARMLVDKCRKSGVFMTSSSLVGTGAFQRATGPDGWRIATWRHPNCYF